MKARAWWLAAGVLGVAFLATRKAAGVWTDTANRVGTLASKQAWAQQLAAVVAVELPQLSEAARTLVVAHGGLESGWGTGPTLARGNHNVFNITAGRGYQGAVDVAANADRSYAASDCQAQGRPMAYRDSAGRPYCVVDQRWRAYTSGNEAVRDYWDFLNRQVGGRYVRAAAALERADVLAFAGELGRAGYYTLPAGDYAKQLQGVYSTAQRFLRATA